MKKLYTLVVCLASYVWGQPVTVTITDVPAYPNLGGWNGTITVSGSTRICAGTTMPPFNLSYTVTSGVMSPTMQLAATDQCTAGTYYQIRFMPSSGASQTMYFTVPSAPTTTTFAALNPTTTPPPLSGGGTGSVTSVGLSLPAIFSVSGSPVTASGTLTGALASQSANRVFAGPTTGSAATPAFRALVSADIPDLSAIYALTGHTHASYPTYSSGNGAPVGVCTAPAIYADKSTTPDTLYHCNGGVWAQIGGTGEGGGVTSVGLSAPNIFTVSGSPVTTSGTLALGLATQAQNTFLAGPTSGTATPTFRAISTFDLPNLSSIYQPYDGDLTDIGNMPKTDDTILIPDGAQWRSVLLPPCSDATTSKLLYNTATNQFTCGTDQTALGGESGVSSLGGLTGNLTFVDDTNMGITEVGTTLTLGWIGTLAKARQNAATAYTDAGNTWSGAQNFSGATSLTVPVGVTSAPTVSGQIAYRTDTDRYVVGVNGAMKTLAFLDSNITGSAAYLTTARTIGNVPFDGSAPIVPQTVQVVASTDPTSFLVMADSQTGDQQMKTVSTVTVNPTTGVITASGFSGPLTGAVAGNASTASALAANPAACGSNLFVTDTAADGTLTCTAITDAAVPDNITASNYIPLAGGTFTGLVTVDNLGLEFEVSDTNSCTAGQYRIFADASEGKWKKCWNGNLTDMDTTGGTPSFDTIGSGTNANALVIGTGGSLTVGGTGYINATRINGTSLASLATGILKNTTSTGVPSIATAGDFPVLNQDTTGSAAKVRSGTSLPASCGVGELYFLTTATSGIRLYVCDATDSWQYLNSMSGTGAGILTMLEGTVVGAGTNAGEHNLGFDSADSLLKSRENGGPLVTYYSTANPQTTITGNAGTATALAANPAACGANLFVTDTAANGDLTCTAITDAAVPDTITVSNYLPLAGGTLTGSMTLYSAAAPTTDAAGKIAFDNNAWAASHGAAQIYDGTANTYVVAAQASDIPSAGQVLKYNANGTITWEPDSTGGSPSFDLITSATNTTAAMVIGTGASLSVTGSGTIAATTAAALAANPTDCSANNFATTIAANGNLTCAQPTPANLATGTLAVSMPVGNGGSVSPTGTGVVSANQINGTALSGLATGLLKNTTSTGVPSIAVAGTDYAPATSGSAILKGNGSGGFSAAAAGTDYIAPYGSTTQKYFLAAPNGVDGTPTFRAIVASDIPTPTQITVASESADTSSYIAFFTDSTGNLGPKTSNNLTYNSATGAFGATSVYSGGSPVATAAAGGSLTTSGAFGVTLTATALTNVTLPTSGTLATTAGNVATATALAANGGNCSAGSFPLGVDASGAVESCATVDSAVSAASDTVAGKVELATAAETTTATDTGRALTPAGLAASDFGKRVIMLEVVADDTALAAGDGKLYFPIPSEYAGWNIVSVAAHVGSAVSSSGAVNVDIARCAAVATGVRCSGTVADVLSTNLTIDANEDGTETAAAAAAIDTANDDLPSGGHLRIDIDGAGTGTKGLWVKITVQKT